MRLINELLPALSAKQPAGFRLGNVRLITDECKSVILGNIKWPNKVFFLEAKGVKLE